MSPIGLLTVEEAGRLLIDAATYTDEALLYGAYDLLRARDPIHLIEHPDFPPVWALTRHKDVVEVAKNSREWPQSKPHSLRSYNELAAMAEMEFPPLRFLVNMDGAEHRAYRNLTATWFQPRSLKSLQDRLAELATRAVDRMAELGSTCDFAHDIAIPYPMQVILSILGLPESDYELMLRLTQQMLCPADAEFSYPPGASAAATFTDSVETFYRYFMDVQRDRQAHPTEDLASLIANAELPDLDLASLPLAEAMGYYVVFAVAGHDTAASSIAGGMRAFIEHPDQLQRLKDNPELIGSAADEIIRWVSPARHFLRTAAVPYEFGSHQFQPGDTVFLAYPSANHDGTVFRDPYTFDIGRTPNPHVAFGFGPHFCLGAHLARMEVRAVFTELVRRLRHVEFAGEPELGASIAAGGLKRLPIRYELD